MSLESRRRARRMHGSMISRDFLRKEYERLPELYRGRNLPPGALEDWKAIDVERRDVITRLEAARAEKNGISEKVGALRRAKQDATELQERSKELAAAILTFEESLKALDARFAPIEETLPNVPHSSVPPGADESANVVVKTWGEPTRFDFPPLAHWDLGPALGILDFERAAKITGSRFTVLKGGASLLNRALLQFMLDLHTREHGYTEIWPPAIVNAASLFGTGQLPKFEEDLFRIRESDWYLSSTSEVQLTNLHRDEILPESALPISYCAYSACFRAEAGAAGRDTRGMIRQHQSIELQVREAEESYAASRRFKDAESILEAPSSLPALSAAAATSGSSAKTYDLRSGCPGRTRTRRYPPARTSRTSRRGGLRSA